MLTRAGKFAATVLEFDIIESKHKQCAMINFKIIGENVGGAWTNIESHNIVHLDYFYLEKNDGNINEITLKQIQRAFGGSLAEMYKWQETAIGQECQLVVEANEYNGKTMYRVKYLNNINHKQETVSPEKAAGFMARHAAALAALDAGVPVVAAAADGEIPF